MGDYITEEMVRRAVMLEKLNADKELQAAVLELCKRDPIYWINNFAWSYDPRAKDRAKMLFPIRLYEYQEWHLREFKRCIDEGESFVIEKSRDMGATWMVLLLFVWYWLFVPNTALHLGSMAEADVDDGPGTNSLFGKMRLVLEKLPAWMMPKQWTSIKLSLANDENGSTITGQSASKNFGRSRRYTACLMDELAFWEFDRWVWEQMDSTTDCRIALSTPNGEGNQFHDLVTSSTIERCHYPKAKQLAEEKGLIARGISY